MKRGIGRLVTGRESRGNKEAPPLSISVHDPREHIVGVGAGADE